MDAIARSIVFLCDEKKLKIPFFQRPYVWKYENVKLLLNDLFYYKGKHFIGSVLIKKSNKNPEPLIIDGQQRLTTLSILIKVLYEKLSENQNGFNYSINDTALHALFVRENMNEYSYKLINSYLNIQQFQEVIGKVEEADTSLGKIPFITSSIRDVVLQEIAQETSLTDDEIKERYNSSENLIRECYKYFTRQIMNKDINEVMALWEQLFNKDNPILVLITIDDTEQEQEIFDTINSSGMHLSSTDIIKNHLYEKMKSFNISEQEVYDYYLATWQKTFEDDPDTNKFWTSERNIGRNMRDNLELLFQAIGIIKKIYEVRGDTLSDLAKKYKEYINDELTDINKIKAFINEIMDYARIYKDEIPQFSNDHYYVFDNVQERVSCVMEKTNNTTFTPFILYLYKKYEKKPKVLNDRLSLIDRVLMHYVISGKNTGNFNKFCNDLIVNENKGEKSFNKYIILNKIDAITEEEIIKGLRKQSNNAYAKLILFWIELYRKGNKNFSDANYTGVLFTNELELEHIMPRGWNAKNSEWKSVPFVNEKGIIIQDEKEGKENRDCFVYSLGNMTILARKLNNPLKNKSFYKKINGDNTKAKKTEVPSIREGSSFSITTEIVPAKKEKETSNAYIWNEKRIFERERAFAKEVLKIWPLLK